MIDLGRYFILILKNKSKFYYRIEHNEDLQEEFRDEHSMMEYQISKQGDEQSIVKLIIHISFYQ